MLAFGAMLTTANAATKPTNKGLDRYNFFYAGENFDHRAMFIVKNGHVVWKTDETENGTKGQNPAGGGFVGEISDATWMDDGHILLAHQYGVEEIAVDTVKWTSKVVWRRAWTRPDYEVHSIQPIGKKYVVFAVCANKADGTDRFKPNGYKSQIEVRRISDWKLVRSFPYPANAKRHNINRSIRLTPQGTLVVAAQQPDDAIEYDSHGRQLRKVHCNGLWGVEILDNGNWLLTGNNTAHEYDKNGKEVWSYNWGSDQSIKTNPAYIGNKTGDFHLEVQKAFRLPDGTTILNNWGGWGSDTYDDEHQPIQFRGVDKNKKVVWELQSWNGNDYLGPSTIFQLLSRPVKRSQMHFGEIDDNYDPSATETLTEDQYYLYNVGQKKFVKTGGLAKDPDIPNLVSKSEATAEYFVKANNGSYTICDPDYYPQGWGVQGRNTIYESNNGSVKTNSFGTSIIPGWKAVPTGDRDGSVYFEYTWNTWTAGNKAIADPSNKTFVLTYGNYDQATDSWSDAQRNDVAKAVVFGGSIDNLAKYGSNAKWIMTKNLDNPTATGITSLEADKAASSSEVYDLNGQKVANDASQLKSLPKNIYIVNGRKVVVK